MRYKCGTLCTFDSGSCRVTATGSVQADFLGGGWGITTGPVLAMPYDSALPPFTVGADVPLPGFVGELDVTYTSEAMILYAGVGGGNEASLYAAVPVGSRGGETPKVVNFLFRYWLGLE